MIVEEELRKTSHGTQRGAEIVGDGIDEGFKLLVGGAQIAGALGDGFLQVGSVLFEPRAGFGEGLLLTLLSFEKVAHLVLAATGMQSYFEGTKQCVRANRAFKEREAAGGGGGQIEQSWNARLAAFGQNDDRQFRPGRLCLEECEEIWQRGKFKGLISKEQRADTVGIFVAKLGKSAGNFGVKAVRVKNGGHGGSVLADRRDNDDAL